MKISTFPEDWVARKQQSSLIDSAARTALFRVLDQLEQGRLVEVGSWDELVARGGRFASMAQARS